jgi:Membrane-associated phospholipid phosphatase
MFNLINNLDGYTLLFIQQHMRTPILTPFLKLLTDMGNSGLIWLIITIALLCFKKTRSVGLAALLSLVVCFIINNEILKNVIARPRPFTQLSGLNVLIPKPSDFSFPSGHTASSFAAAGAFFYCGNKKWGILALILAGFIGFSRLYLGVHYPSDVLFGALLGMLISFIVNKVIKYYQHHRQVKAVVNE